MKVRFVPRSKHPPCRLYKNLLKLLKEITVVCSKKHSLHRRPLEGKFKTWSFNSSGKQTSHYDSNGCMKRNATDKD